MEKIARTLLLMLVFSLSNFAWAEPAKDEAARLALNPMEATVKTSLDMPNLPSTDDLNQFIAPKTVADQVVGKTSSIVNTAMGFLGVPYRFGGNGVQDGGFDCSGLVRAVYEKATGKMLPRRAADQADATHNIPKGDLQPGDLVFFTTVQRAINHVGIYLGNDQFVHAPRTGGRVRVEKLSTKYWETHFIGARRVEASQQN